MRQEATAPGHASDNGHSTPGRPRRISELPPGAMGLLARSLKRQWRRYRKELKRCQKKFTPARVHESRVATRRLLSLLELLSPFLAPGRVRKSEAALKQHLEMFDELRDTQVQLQAVRELRHDYPAARRFYNFLREREERLTRKTRKRIKHVKTGRLAELIDAAREELAQRCQDCPPAAANAELLRAVDSTFARARRLRERIAPDDTASIHRTRLAFKKFRYMIETLTKCLPAVDEQLLAAMRRYQMMMGEIQDAEVLGGTFEKFVRKETVSFGIAEEFHRELLRRREVLVDRYLDAADRLRDFWEERKGPGPPPRDRPGAERHREEAGLLFAVAAGAQPGRSST
jgi:CHAD domain-containing protein